MSAVYRAEVLREAAAAVEDRARDADFTESRDHCAGLFEAAELLRRMAEEHGKATPAGTTATQSAESVVYRAEHESIVMGLYASQSAARAHCEAHIKREIPDAGTDWIVDDEDGVAELVARIGIGEHPTGYVVTPLTVASEYDAEADE